jgi:hypothetical protein
MVFRQLTWSPTIFHCALQVLESEDSIPIPTGLAFAVDLVEISILSLEYRVAANSGSRDTSPNSLNARYVLLADSWKIHFNVRSGQ